MPTVITTNVASLNAQRNLSKAQSALGTSLQRLSSGLRINSAKDDAAGLAISNRFTTQTRGLSVAIRNANDGISFAQTTESALDEITTSLQRIRDLAVQAANDSNSASDRQSLQAEVTQLVDEINRIAETTTFNGKQVANGSAGTQTFQVGANAGETVKVGGVDARASALGSQPGQTESTWKSIGNDTGGSVANLANFTVQVAGNTIANVLTADRGGSINAVALSELKDTTDADYGRGMAKDLAARINTLREKATPGLEGTYANAKTTFSYSDVGSAGMTTGASAVAAASAYVGSGSLANGAININGVDIGPVTVLEKDADGALASAINAKSSTTGVKASVDAEGRLTLTADDGRDIILNTSSATVTKQLFGGGDNNFVGSGFTDVRKSGDLTLSSNRTITASAGGYTAEESNVQAKGTVQNVDISTASGASQTIKSVDSALSQIDSYRAALGAVQNRFESTIRNLSAVSESLSAANSRIKDADFAAESANLSKNQVLSQAGNSILAQANAIPQQALSLLGG
jgi:flagellin